MSCLTPRGRTRVVRAWSLVLAVSMLAACGGQTAAPQGTSTGHDPFVLSEDQQRRFEQRLAREFTAAPRRRDRDIRANRSGLDRLRLFPGAVLRDERHQGNEVDDATDGEELLYALYVSEHARPYERYELVTADSWSTYRHYLLPRATDTIAVKQHYARLFRGWAHVARERGVSALGGHQFFADDYWRDGRCVWVHVGSREGPLPAARTLVVATMANRRGECV